MVAGHRVVAAGLVHLRTDVHFHAGHDQARNQLVETDDHQRGVPVRAGLPGLAGDLPAGRAAGSWLR
ncbi:hypothetical protein XAP6164_5490006 [Xanthomonas phaseoli pv. phaseoli]|nr:hypothetical protein XAP6164_5490006 [Xanthomonas phaseoli pv. phaseoli]